MTEEQVTVTFTDTVKRIWKKPDADVYDVIFRRRAAFYSLDSTHSDAADALMRSAEHSLQVKVLCNALNSAIIEASVIE
jgi:hypothetical protein